MQPTPEGAAPQGDGPCSETDVPRPRLILPPAGETPADLNTLNDPLSIQLGRYLTGILESVFYEDLGVVNPPVTDYLSLLITRSTQIESLYSARSPQEWHSSFYEMYKQDEGEFLAPLEQRERNKSIGDVSLVLVGLFPETFAKSEWSRADVMRIGATAYRVAGQFFEPPYEAESELMNFLSEEYELCAHGLSLVARSLFSKK